MPLTVTGVTAESDEQRSIYVFGGERALTGVDNDKVLLSYAESYLLPAHPNCAGALSSPVRHL